MKTTEVKLYSLNYSEIRTYLFGLLFVAGNIILPQCCHLIPQGGLTWLPIYFFTLIGAYKFGWKVGLLTALLSPLVNSFAFGMPATAMLPGILLKSCVLAGTAAFIARRYQKVSLGLLLAVVLGYQIIGTLGEWLICGDIWTAFQDFRIGLPGMAVQVIGGYLFIKYWKY